MGKKILDSKLLYALLAIAASIALWFYVATVENPDGDIEISGIPITFLNEEVLGERGLMISSGHDQTVTLQVVGPKTTLAKLDQEKEKITLTIDVSKITSPGEQRMAYTVSLPTGYNSSVQIAKQYPANIDFTVSRRIQKEIEVQGKFDGTLAEGYMRDDFEILPGKIEVWGIESEVNRISHALVTVSGDDLTTTFTGDMGFQLISYQGEVLKDLNVECSVETVSVTMPVLKTADVPLAVKWVLGGGVTDVDKYVTFDIDPEVITVSGAEEDLEPLQEIILGEIELANIISGNDTFEFDIPLDSTLENISGVTKATITVSIHGLETKILDVDNIVVKTPDGFEGQAVTQSLQVLVRGAPEALDLVFSHNLRVVADLSGTDVSVGRYTVPVKVYLDSTSDVGVVGSDYKIVVDISK
ncbi:MAG: YbbR-like domain-containing protein [Oscillospiraceae bacterium]